LHIKPAEKKPFVEPKPSWNLEITDNQAVHDENHPDQQDQTAIDKPTKVATKDADKKPAKSDYKQEKEKILKLNFDDETNWNYLFMNQDTVAASMAKQLNQTKGEYLDRD